VDVHIIIEIPHDKHQAHNTQQHPPVFFYISVENVQIYMTFSRMFRRKYIPSM